MSDRLHIQRVKNSEELSDGIKWLVVDNALKCTEACDSLWSAIKYYFWHCGVPPKFLFKQHKVKL